MTSFTASKADQSARLARVSLIESLESRIHLDALPGTISGTVSYQFANHGAVIRRPLTDWTVYADKNDNGQWDPGEPIGTSNLQGAWTISGLAPGSYVVREYVKPGWTLDPGTPAVAADATDGTSGVVFYNEMTSPAVIDVMILYTPAALAADGGSAADPTPVVTDVRRQLDDADQVAANSDANLRFNLVYCAEEKYTESGSAEKDLGRLVKSGDGYMDNIQKLRNAVGADLVILYTDDAKSHDDVIGEGYEYQGGPNASAFGYSVVTNYKTGHNIYTMAHELGHNLGANHDRPNAIPNAPYPFAYGYPFTGDDGQPYQDVMSYGTGIVLPVYSDPNFSYAGRPAGDASDDNALAVRETAPIVAAYRQPPAAAKQLGAASLAATGAGIIGKHSIIGGTHGIASVRVQNKGGSAFSGPVDIRFYLSTETQFNGSAALIGDEVGETFHIAAGGSKVVRVNLQYPSNLASGQYHLMALVDRGGVGTSDASTVLADGTALIQYAQPVVDLRLISASASSAARPGGALALHFSLANDGNITDNESVSVQLLASSDGTVSATDTILLTLPSLTISLRPGRSRTFAQRAIVPRSMPAGSYFLVAAVDAPSQNSVPRTITSVRRFTIS